MGIIIKTPQQIEGIRASCHLARNSLKYIASFIKPGIKTGFINEKVEEYIHAHGGKSATLNYHGYPASCCTSVNDIVCHGIPGDYVLKEGDVLNVDVSTVLHDFYGDTCMMYPIGEVGHAAKDLLAATHHCPDLGIAQCRPGNKMGNVGYVISQYAQENGYSVVYQFCGHGVGTALHEDPEVSHIEDANTGIIMQPGMTFTIEPMINAGKARVKTDKDGWTTRTIDGRLSAQYEHTILITENGVEVLTDIDHEYDDKGELMRVPILTFK